MCLRLRRTLRGYLQRAPVGRGGPFRFARLTLGDWLSGVVSWLAKVGGNSSQLMALVIGVLKKSSTWWNFEGFSRCRTAPQCCFSIFEITRGGSVWFSIFEIVRWDAVRLSLLQNHTVWYGFSPSRFSFTVQCGVVRITFFKNRAEQFAGL